MGISKKDQVLQVIKNVELEVMDEIHRICTENDIKYNLAGGTCLGAVRHGGFIPWDDDIDIDMDRAEYERFHEICKTKLNHDKFYLQDRRDDSDYHSYTPRLAAKGTVINNKSSEVKGLIQPICVDIFIHDYLPNDEQMRKEYLEKIYLTKVYTYFKWYGSTVHIPNEEKAAAKKFIDKKDYKYFYDEFDKYCINYYHIGEKTDYIIDTSVIHGNYGGFPASIKEEYIDIKFEDRTYKTLKDYDTYLTLLYGPNYMEIFPYYKRISHHKLKRVDLGPYAKKYDIDPSMVKYIMMNLDTDRLAQVKKVSLEMLDVIDEICKKYDIVYYISGNDCLYEGIDKADYAKIWRDDITVLMNQKNYDKFVEVAPGELTHFYFLENMDSSEDYFFPYSKLKLNYTCFRDRRTFPAKVNEGVWINIGVLVNTSDNPKLRKKHFDDIKKAYNDVRLKWLYDDVRGLKLKEKDKVVFKAWKKLKRTPLEKLVDIEKKVINRYANEETCYYIESTTSLVPIPEFKKEIFGEGERREYLGHSYLFPSDLKGYVKAAEAEPKLKKHMASLNKIKDTDPKRYEDLCKELTPKQVKKMNKKVSLFELGMYDAPDYRSGAFDLDI